MTWRITGGCLALFLVVLSAGCAGKDTGKPADDKEKKIAEARAKLEGADRAAVEAQDVCPVMPDQRLGALGVPIKVTVKGETFFLCCKACKTTADDDPDGTLKKLAELKAKKK